MVNYSHLKQSILMKLYDFNHDPSVWTVKDYAAGSWTTKKNPENLHEWGGGRARRLLQAVYVISFLCLLRVDEVLKIQVHDIERVDDRCFKLTLPFRKTSQVGGEWVS